MRLPRRTGVSAALAWLVFAACADPLRPDQLTSLDYLLAESSGALSPAPMSFVAQPQFAHGDPPLASTCAYDSSSTMFSCPALVWNGATFHTSYQLLDVFNQALASRDPAVIAAVRSVRTSDYVVVLSGDTAHHSIHNVSDRTLSGLLTGDRIVNSLDTNYRVSGLGSIVRLTTEVMTVSNFSAIKASAPGSFPTTGTITVLWRIPAIGAATSDSGSTVMTFDGSGTVSWRRNSVGVSQTCTYNFSLGGAPTCT